MSGELNTVSTVINAVPPYDFKLTASYATYFRGHYGTDVFEDGIFRRLLDIDDRFVLAAVSSEGTIDSPQLKLELTAHSLSDEVLNSARQQVSRILGTEQNLLPFYAKAYKDTSLASLVHGLYGLHVPQTGSVFEALVLAILGAADKRPGCRKAQNIFNSDLRRSDRN